MTHGSLERDFGDLRSRDALARFVGIGKSFRKGRDTIQIFENLDFSIARSDFLAVMGPSGSGKTTMLNLLGGLDRPDGGELVVAGTRIDRLSDGALARWRGANIGFVFQFYNLMPVLSATRNVELPLLLTNLSARERRRRAEAALDIVGLSDRKTHRPRELSGGQQQRVAIARAIVSDPVLLLCDEPTGDLDRASSNQILEMLRLLNTELGKAVVMVTHDATAARFAKRSVLLDKGRFAPGMTAP